MKHIFDELETFSNTCYYNLKILQNILLTLHIFKYHDFKQVHLTPVLHFTMYFNQRSERLKHELYALLSLSYPYKLCHWNQLHKRKTYN